MELPFTIVFEPPSRSELRALLRMRGHWAAGLIVALTIGTAYLLANVARADSLVVAGIAPLALTSQPAGASVWVDGRARGATPLELIVEPGVHSVLLKAPAALDRQYTLEVGSNGTALAAVLWREHAEVTHLRPALPGATLVDVRLLADGELGLSIALPTGRQEAWRLEPSNGALESLTGDLAGSRLAFAPDGRHLAYVGPEVGPPAADLNARGSAGPPVKVVWTLDADRGSASSMTGWRAPLEASEQLADVAWSPRQDHLLVVSSQVDAGGARRSRGWFIDPDGQESQLALDIPSDVVPGTVLWSPDGAHVAFVAHAAGVNALCLLGLDGTFRYIADLDPSEAPPLAYPPLSWSTDGQRLLFVAPHQHLAGAPLDWLQPDAQHAVYVASIDQPTPSDLVDTPVDQVSWREDGQWLGLARRSTDGPLSIRLLNSSSGAGQELLPLALKPGAQYVGSWDLVRARLLVVSRNAAAGTDFWLVQLGAEADA